MKKNEVALMFSGGTESTLSAALVKKDFELIHLLTYKRLGLFNINNSKLVVQNLQNKFKEVKFIHKIISIEKIFKYISYENYFSRLRKYGFFVLSTCGLCKLAMHIRTIKYCLENNIKYACDGSNSAMDIFPFQMDILVEEMKKLYSHFGITYFTPVFADKAFSTKQLIKAENMELLKRKVKHSNEEENRSHEEETTGYKLHVLGLAPDKDIKGTLYDRQRQARCFQLILFNVFANRYFLYNHTMEEYRKKTFEFFQDKISFAKVLLEDNLNNKEHIKLFR